MCLYSALNPSPAMQVKKRRSLAPRPFRQVEPRRSRAFRPRQGDIAFCHRRGTRLFKLLRHHGELLAALLQARHRLPIPQHRHKIRHRLGLGINPAPRNDLAPPAIKRRNHRLR